MRFIKSQVCGGMREVHFLSVRCAKDTLKSLESCSFCGLDRSLCLLLEIC